MNMQQQQQKKNHSTGHFIKTVDLHLWIIAHKKNIEIKNQSNIAAS